MGEVLLDDLPSDFSDFSDSTDSMCIDPGNYQMLLSNHANLASSNSLGKVQDILEDLLLDFEDFSDECVHRLWQYLDITLG